MEIFKSQEIKFRKTWNVKITNKKNSQLFLSIDAEFRMVES